MKKLMAVLLAALVVMGGCSKAPITNITNIQSNDYYNVIGTWVSDNTAAPILTDRKDTLIINADSMWTFAKNRMDTNLATLQVSIVHEIIQGATYIQNSRSIDFFTWSNISGFKLQYFGNLINKTTMIFSNVVLNKINL